MKKPPPRISMMSGTLSPPFSNVVADSGGARGVVGYLAALTRSRAAAKTSATVGSM